VTSRNGFHEESVSNVIPLTTADKIVPLEERDASMRAAVAQVITDLVIRRVPPEDRSPMFEAAADLLDRAGRGLGELIEAAEPGPEQDALFEELGLR
jgi:acyl-CoA reductase-like NAD-dependent aldehyde dehydrogenase